MSRARLGAASSVPFRVPMRSAGLRQSDTCSAVTRTSSSWWLCVARSDRSPTLTAETYILIAFLCSIFGYKGELGETVKYVNWMSEIRAGLMALEFYNADLNKWGQVRRESLDRQVQEHIH